MVRELRVLVLHRRERGEGGGGAGGIQSLPRREADKANVEAAIGGLQEVFRPERVLGLSDLRSSPLDTLYL